MARGRKLTMSRSDRYLGSYSYGGGHGASVTDQPEDLAEDDIWSAAEHTPDPCGSWNPRAAGNGSWSAADEAHDPRPTVSDGAWSPRTAGTARGGLALAFEDSSTTSPSSSPRIVHQSRWNDRVGGGRKLATSAPVNVPDWSKIYRVNSVESIHESEEEEENGRMMPPHEYVARSRKIGGASVFEAVGRTLKGRELRRVRDAVWSQTGFYG